LCPFPAEIPSGKPWAVSLLDEANLQVLLVSQFTLFAKLKKPKPDFHAAMGGEAAELLFNRMVEEVKKGLAPPAPKAKARRKPNVARDESIEAPSEIERCEERAPEDQQFAERVQTGVFGAYMGVTIENDGPVTIVIDSEEEVPRKEQAKVDVTTIESVNASESQ
jgi:D-tyrosyl-tRNA(Tyr) deacylase